MIPSTIHDVFLTFYLCKLLNEIKYFDIHDFREVAKQSVLVCKCIQFLYRLRYFCFKLWIINP